MSTGVNSLMSTIADIGTDPIRGGYSRPAYSDSELTLREWFISEARSRGLEVYTDGNGIIWAWWDLPSSWEGDASRVGALVTGSHLDSVPGGGAFDGPLGVASALAAVDVLKARETAGQLIRGRALAVTVLPEEEGSRFGVACLGSRLLTGAIDLDKALNLKDADGLTFGEVAQRNGLNARYMGRDPQAIQAIGDFVELHVEQGRGLNTAGFTSTEGKQSAVAVGSSILGHGRWRISVRGQGNHAGTTLMTDRSDPMVAAAEIVLAVKRAASRREGARGTVGRIEPVPGGTNVIASRVEIWLDVRHPDDAVTAQVVEEIYRRTREISAVEGCSAQMTEESYSGTVHFNPDLTRSLQVAVQRTATGAPVLDTGAGHDAGVLAAHVPSGMLFVRNPSGISHSPEEYVEDDDAEAGVVALADALAELL